MSSEKTLIDLALSQPQSAIEALAYEASNQDAISANSIKIKRKLIPTKLPGHNQQFAFEVDVDRCSGCKGCVSACHHMNGLDTGESWRRVKQWFGKTESSSWVHTVTSACHHCLNAECMLGCPVGAYEKNPISGIVKHLDDQCIGCEYCIWKCPYEVPEYHSSHGVVRKCDMCSDRLGMQIEPACVQACPHDAIRIETVDQPTIAEQTNYDPHLGQGMYPEAAPSSITKPTTIYRSTKELKSAQWSPLQGNQTSQKAHWPLVIMLVMTQWGLGMIIGNMFWTENSFRGGPSIGFLLGLALVVSGLISSALHLGQPTKAWRFFLGLRTSWLSREILAFTLLSLLLFADGMCQWLHLIPPNYQGFWQWIVTASIASAVMTSVMIYHDTHRPSWRMPLTSMRFFSTLAIGLILLLWEGFVRLDLDQSWSILMALFLTLFSGWKLQLGGIFEPCRWRILVGFLWGLTISWIWLVTLSELVNVSGPHTWVWKLLVGLMLVSCDIIERRQFFISTRAPVGHGVGSWASG